MATLSDITRALESTPRLTTAQLSSARTAAAGAATSARTAAASVATSATESLGSFETSLEHAAEAGLNGFREVGDRVNTFAQWATIALIAIAVVIVVLVLAYFLFPVRQAFKAVLPK